MSKLSFSGVIEQYPCPKEVHFRQDIARILAEQKFKIIVLDDDPTGIQTVHDCLLITKWDEKNLIRAFEDSVPFFYILTNSRSINADDAEKLNRDIIDLIIKINKSYQYRLIFISRSDSTLRGHFPLEPNTILSTVQANHLKVNLPVFFIPSFLEVGRYTINNIHYLKDSDMLIPVAETEFARDNVFSYKSSDLNEYIIEKSNGKVKKESIGFISIETLRNNSIEETASIILSNKNKEYLIINALDYFDLRKFTLAVLKCSSGNNSCIIFRTSSSFPKALSGISDKPLLTKEELIKENGVGIFFIGSHVKKTSLQLSKLLESDNVEGIELNIKDTLNSPDQLPGKLLESISDLAVKGITPVIYTSREEIRFSDKNERLDAGKNISNYLVNIVKNLPFKPSYLVAKGGITSNDIMAKGLCIENARVMGQVLTGVPVISADADNRFPDLSYIIFPGNVGDEDSLRTVFEKLR